jgi:hypothetical protein
LDFDGTLVLEKLKEIGKMEQFLKAIECDDFPKQNHCSTENEKIINAGEDCD